MSDYDLLTILSILSLFLGLLFTIFLFTAKAKNRLTNHIFGVFMFFSAIDNAFVSKALHDNHSNIGVAIGLTVFLQLPIFYLYVKSVCYIDFRLREIHIVHAIPYAIGNLLVLSSAYGVDQDSSLILLSELSQPFKNKLIHLMVHVQVFSYLIAAFLVVRRSKKLYFENFADVSIPFYNWLMQLISLLTVLHVFAIFKNVYKFSDDDGIYYWTRVALISIELLMFCWYVLKALNHPNLFKSVDSKLTLASAMANGPIPSNQTLIDNDEEVKKVRRYMSAKKPFLEPSLTIQELAGKLKLPTKELSVLINQKMGQHFFDFVNGYRIEEAKNILKDSERKDYTVLEILYKVGFNSKSSFNTAFKKYTGTTPTLYRTNPKKSKVR